ncbi:MAG: hypothetical protein JO102_06825 [Elusimicrobia bacterium]|nr:hypothetical protein [Elusimicrobiota bacterium]
MSAAPVLPTAGASLKPDNARTRPSAPKLSPARPVGSKDLSATAPSALALSVAGTQAAGVGSSRPKNADADRTNSSARVRPVSGGSASTNARTAGDQRDRRGNNNGNRSPVISRGATLPANAAGSSAFEAALRSARDNGVASNASAVGQPVSGRVATTSDRPTASGKVSEAPRGQTPAAVTSGAGATGIGATLAAEARAVLSPANISLGLTVAVAIAAVAIGLAIHPATAVELALPGSVLAAIAAFAAVVLSAAAIGASANAGAPTASIAVAGASPVLPASAVTPSAPSMEFSSAASAPVSTTILSTLATFSVALNRFTNAVLFPSSPAATASTSAAATAPTPDILLNRIAAIAAINSLVSILSSRPGDTVESALRTLAEDNLSDQDREIELELARATRDAARAAVARRVYEISTETRGENGPTENGGAASVPADSQDLTPTLVEIRDVALVLSDKLARERTAAPQDERSRELSDSVARGNLLLRLEGAWDKEILHRPVEPTSKPVRVFRLQSSRRPQPSSSSGSLEPRVVVDRGEAVLTERGQRDEAVAREQGRQSGAGVVAERIGVPAKDVLEDFDADRLPVAQKRVVAAFVDGTTKASSLATAEVDAARRRGARTQAAGASANPTEQPTTALDQWSAALSGRVTAQPTPESVDLAKAKLEQAATAAAVGGTALLIVSIVAIGIAGAPLAAAIFSLIVVISAAAARLYARRLPSAAPVPENETSKGAPSAGRTTGASDEELEQLATIIATFVGHAERLRTPDGIINFSGLLPHIAELGVEDRARATGVGGLTADETERLATILLRRLKVDQVEHRMDVDDAIRLLSFIAANAGGAQDLRVAAGDKDVFYPVHLNGNNVDAEMDGVAEIVGMLGAGRHLYLPYEDNDDVAKAVAARFNGDATAGGRIRRVAPAAPIYRNPNGRAVLVLASLAANLSGLSKTEAKNLIVLVPQGVAWDATGLPKGTVLDWVGFILLKDFVSGVPIDKVGLLNIGRLAEIIASQA